MSLDTKLLEILACPEDKGPLFYFASDAFLYNPRLHRKYVVRDGIPVMLVEESVAVDAAEHTELERRIVESDIWLIAAFRAQSTIIYSFTYSFN